MNLYIWNVLNPGGFVDHTVVAVAPNISLAREAVTQQFEQDAREQGESDDPCYLEQVINQRPSEQRAIDNPVACIVR